MSKGIKSFLLDTQMDKDVRLIEARFGLTGYAILVKLWTMIYRDEGYYCKWDDDTKCLFAREIGADKKKVEQIVEECLRRGLFSNEIYNQFLVLTSATIQKRFLQYKARAKFVEIEKCFQCVNFSPNEYKNIRIVDNISKNVSISAPIRLDMTRLDVTDDDIGKTVDLDRWNMLLVQPVQREVEVLNPYNDDSIIINKIFQAKEKLLSMLASIDDPAIIYGLNNCTDSDVNQIWMQACEAFGLEQTMEKKILNPEGYMLKTIENKFRKVDYVGN